MTYAVIKVGSTQERVSEDDVIAVNRLAEEVGKKVSFPVLAYVDEDKNVRYFKKGDTSKVQVSGKVVDDKLRGPKIKIQKFKNKTGYHKSIGHRQELTKVKIESIKVEK